MRLLTLATLLSLALFACEKTSPEQALSPSDAVEFRNNGQPASSCVNIYHTVDAAPIGPVCLPAPLNICSFGALPAPLTVGGISGRLSSVLISQEASGNGATHFSLIHYFEADGGLGAFWTEDRAVCAPAGTDPLTCDVHDVMEIVGGTGIFANAGGQMRNHGTIDFANGTLSVNLRGRVCGDGL